MTNLTPEERAGLKNIAEQWEAQARFGGEHAREYIDSEDERTLESLECCASAAHSALAILSALDELDRLEFLLKDKALEIQQMERTSAFVRDTRDRFQAERDQALKNTDGIVARYEERIADLRRNCACPTCGCAEPDDAECACGDPVCAIELPETLATAYVRVHKERTASIAAMVSLSAIFAAKDDAQKKLAWRDLQHALSEAGIS